ncbi:MAG: hypothetical protein R3320_14065, partial [Nitriliruptorales bacterium]|nr:hypothetical protein [Nitriliruptorales bacterium]
MRDLEHTRAKVQSSSQHLPLRRLLGVTREQHAAAPPPDPDHDRGVVRLALAASERTARRGTQDFDEEVPDGCHLTRDRLVNRHTSLAGEGQRVVECRRCQAGDGAVPDRADIRPTENGWQAAHMIGVCMGNDHKIEPLLPVPLQPSGRPIITARIDEDGATGALDEYRVALTDVDGGDRESRDGVPDRRERHREDADERHGSRSTGQPRVRHRDQPHHDGGSNCQHDRPRSRDHTELALPFVRDPQDEPQRRVSEPDQLCPRDRRELRHGRCGPGQHRGDSGR